MNSILDYFEISKLEVENEVRKLIGLPLININSKIFQTGLINCFGIKNFKIVPKKGFIPTEKDNFKIKEKFEELDNDFNFISNFLNSEEVHNNSKNILKIENDLKKSIEKLRITEYSHPSKEINEKLAKIRTIDEFTYDNLLFKEISLKIFSFLENTEIFFKNLKTAYVFFILNHTRNSLKNTKIKENDIWDLAVYSSSIPYCDIIIGERRWINILKQKK